MKSHFFFACSTDIGDGLWLEATGFFDLARARWIRDRFRLPECQGENLKKYANGRVSAASDNLDGSDASESSDNAFGQRFVCSTICRL